jgi:dihydrofolate synthase/folylpolyglutamate synthase
VATSDGRDLIQRLYRLAPRGARLGLSRMHEACAQLGHPEAAFPAVHVAGTNGKGSVCAMVSAMAGAAGRLVGLYTSPHLCRFEERIQVDGRSAEGRVLFPILEQVLDTFPELTFFEATTLTAFIVFAKLDVEIAVVEVGLGGRLDATNVLPSPVATAITRIAFDHTDRLGHDLASIAREKAGIAKPGVPLFVGRLEPEARREIERVAREVGAHVVVAGNDPGVLRLLEGHPPALGGAHQLDNAAVAIAVARATGLDEVAIVRGLGEVRWPGRLESVTTSEGPLLLDAAHNPDGALALRAALSERRMPREQVALVFGAMADKDYAGMLASLGPLCGTRVYVAPEGRKAADPAELARLWEGTPAATVPEALARARQAVGASGLVVVAGSIFLVGEVRAFLFGLERDPAVAL